MKVLRLHLRPTPAQNQRGPLVQVCVVNPLDNIVSIHEPADGDFHGADLMLSNGHTLRVKESPEYITGCLMGDEQ